ncbi:MAG: hypothetical protein M3N98_12315 [Actinomycetota bacterium]|nr:hypothetical protein [Actinomycetota bacterium]
MDQFPQPGDTLRMQRAGTTLKVAGRLGEGGQGVVYRVAMGDAPFAVKWFRSMDRAAELHRSIDSLVERGRPRHDAFVWPIDVVTCNRLPGFGYVMPLLEPRFVSFAQLLLEPRPPDFRVMVTIARQIVDAFAALHSSGLCYRDINFGNLRVDPQPPAVAIIDNDNVGTDGGEVFVKGTLRFMAPEIVRGEALPSTATDLHSLAVFLFYLFVHGHPFEGNRAVSSYTWDGRGHISESELAIQHFGLNPLFVFDPDDPSNRPMPGDPMLTWWSIYPRFFRAVFIRAFTTGLREANLAGRITEGTWRKNLLRLQDCISTCESCRAAIFDDPDDARMTCWNCRCVPPPPWLMELPGHTVVLAPGSVLTSHHLTRDREHRQVRARVEPVPGRTDLVVLRNLSDRAWMIHPDGEEAKTVEPGQRMGIRAMAVEFGSVKGTIRQRPPADPDAGIPIPH